MSDKSTAYLRLNKKEARNLVGWFLFQEQANIEIGEESTISIEEIKLLNNIRSCLQKMNENPEKYGSIKLAPQYCRIVFNWFSKIPECIIDEVDADIHSNIGVFLNECDGSKPDEGL